MMNLQERRRGDTVTDALELDYAIKKAGLNRPKIAKVLGISMMSLFNKIHNRTEFKASEIAKLVNLLNLKDASIFFGK